MKKFLILALAMCMLPFTADAQKKEKKEKKPYEWNWDGTRSGNVTVDSYLLKIDTLWTKIQAYSDNMDYYQFKDTTITINGDIYQMAWMETSEGKMVTRATCNWQIVESITTGASIVTQCVNANLMAANAGTALPSLGVKALSYGKYLKAAPKIISLGTTEIKELVTKQKNNARRWKELKAGALDETQLATLGIFDEQAIKTMKKCVYLKKLEQTDPTYQTIEESQKQKGDEQLKAEATELAEKFSKAEVMPEDERNKMDDFSEDAFEKEMAGQV